MKAIPESKTFVFGNLTVAELNERLAPFHLGQLVVVNQPNLSLGFTDKSGEYVPPGPYFPKRPNLRIERICGWSDFHQTPQITTGGDYRSCMPYWPYGMSVLSPNPNEDWADGASALAPGTKVTVAIDLSFRGGFRGQAEGIIVLPWRDSDSYFVQFEQHDWCQVFKREALSLC